jgi:23S rRNA (uridine2552-2'-O)-methyltransferase
MARSKSSNRWLREHFTDEYVLRAQKEGYRSRAVYKLKEIDERDRLFQAGQTVVDLGAAPGGWSQYAQKRVGARGRVIALDVLRMDALSGVDFILGDFTETATVEALERVLGGRPVDIVISDMAPNISGVGVADQAKSIYLAELALDFARSHLRSGGTLLLKVFQGAGFNELHHALREQFRTLASRKPQASRGRSREIYLLGKEFSGELGLEP